jgi:hypothetical protein
LGNERHEIEIKIRAAKAELPSAGAIHRRDLIKHIRRMEKELRTYDYYQRKGGALLDAKASMQSG